MLRSLNFLLLQIRNSDDPMRMHEVEVFSRALNANQTGFDCRITVYDLLASMPTKREMQDFDALLLGGSGDYSAADESPWLKETFDFLKLVYEIQKPTFASCWGFQAFARALGGNCIHDPQHSELGAIAMFPTEAAGKDPVFSQLPSPFLAQSGHQDHVTTLPSEAILLASSTSVRNQAFTFPDLPIYCTQFHPELTKADLLTRVKAYPTYVEKIAGVPYDTFVHTCQESPDCNLLLPRFVDVVFDS